MKWSNVEESTLRQKDREIWIEHDDSNSKYFHDQWKIRTIHNTNSSIYIESGLKFAEPLQIEVEFISIFKDLMGTKEKELKFLNRWLEVDHVLTRIKDGDFRISWYTINICGRKEYRRKHHASGLHANNDKSSIFIDGVHEHTKQDIEDASGFIVGTLPFRYLGVHLASQKLGVNAYLPLIEKITTRITCWFSDILKEGTSFLENIYLPGVAGGINVMNVGIWNASKRHATVERMLTFGITIPLNVLSTNHGLGTEVQWISLLARSRSGLAELTSYAFALVVYMVWQARNCIRFQRRPFHSDSMIKDMMLHILTRGKDIAT
ncbi:hypothetical protein H5410_045639 [Solanum commersonii]|uniref:Uncharacterized protein n=1 Tax=Solanum commersonii TaxID=4109 RepID=A0A9J5XC66_SOLCO|nr:hypothetical protein H5410_045639 [Solanum commersonii]